MASVVVWCPGCRAVARVGPEAVGQLVQCPECGVTFVAAEEAASGAPPRPAARPTREPSDRRPREREWDRERDRRDRTDRRSRRPAAVPVDADDPAVPDPHVEQPGGLPLSVMIGLALLPFVIPLVWLLAPAVFGQAPALSVAAPAALAVAASALCLAVVYTVDWTPPTRVRGVLILLTVAAFTGVGLYFLEKAHVERVRGAIGGKEWVRVREADQKYEVELPPPGANGRPQPDAGLLPGWNLVVHRMSAGGKTFVVGSGLDPNRGQRGNRNFGDVQDALAAPGGAVGKGVPEVKGGVSGMQWIVRPRNGGTVRLVRTYRAHGRLYYQSVEGPNLRPNDRDAGRFFGSLQIEPGDKN